jgi:hypothetical protein
MGSVYDTQASALAQRLHSVAKAECEHPSTPRIEPTSRAESFPSTTTAGTPLTPSAAQYCDTPAKKLFIEFLELRFGIEFQGFQKGFAGPTKQTPDLILFSGPYRTTLALPVEKLLDTENAIELIRQKKADAEEKFGSQDSEESAEALETVAWG